MQRPPGEMLGNTEGGGNHTILINWLLNSAGFAVVGLPNRHLPGVYPQTFALHILKFSKLPSFTSSFVHLSLELSPGH